MVLPILQREWKKQDELRMNPLIPKDVPIHGLIFHPRTAVEIEVIVNGYTQM